MNPSSAASVHSPAARDGHVDVLRGLAILSILIMHAAAMTPGIDDRHFLHVFFSGLSRGMQLFFVLSGYLISRSWERLREQPNALGAYAIKRVFKIAPLYLLFLHLYIAAFLWLFRMDPSPVTFTNSISEATFTPGNYFAHLFFAQGLVPGWIDTLLDGGWSIVAEVYFYVLFPLILARYADTIHKAFKTYVFTLAFAILLAELLTGRLERYFGYRNFLAQLPCFMLGVLAYRILRDKALEAALARWAPALLAFAVVLAVGMINGNLSPVGVHNVYGLVFMTMLLSLSRLPGRDAWVNRLTVLRVMGQQSYALFFTHLLLLKFQTHYLVGRMGAGHFWEILGLNLATSVVVTFMVTTVLVHPIDQFFVRLSSRLADRLLKSPR